MNWYNVGKIVNTHGIRGEVRVISQTDFPEDRYEIGSKLGIFAPGEKKPTVVIIKTARKHKNFMLLSFENYPNINDVEKFKGSMLKVNENYLEELEEDEFYYHEIIGCDVFDTEGNEIGQVKEIFETGANDVWTIKGVDGKEHYIPVIYEVIKEVDVEAKRVTIELMEGLLS